jgi:hypothetical protein
MREAIENFGADATRLCLADAGDGKWIALRNQSDTPPGQFEITVQYTYRVTSESSPSRRLTVIQVPLVYQRNNTLLDNTKPFGSA